MDLSTIPLGFNIPFNKWEIALMMNNKIDKEIIPMIGSTVQQTNTLFTLDNQFTGHYNGTQVRHTASHIDNDNTNRTWAIGANLDLAIDNN